MWEQCAKAERLRRWKQSTSKATVSVSTAQWSCRYFLLGIKRGKNLPELASNFCKSYERKLIGEITKLVGSFFFLFFFNPGFYNVHSASSQGGCLKMIIRERKGESPQTCLKPAFNPIKKYYAAFQRNLNSSLLPSPGLILFWLKYQNENLRAPVK